MGLGCPICSEQLHRLPAEASQRNTENRRINDTDINISATPCGHLFHSYCINKWLSGTLASSKQCPCCRKPVPGLKVLPLYPNSFDDSILDDSLSQETGGASCNCNVTISSLKTQIDTLKEECNDAVDMSKINKDIGDEFKKKFEAEKLKSNQLLYQWKQFESYKDYSEQKERECLQLSAELKKYQVIDSLVKGTKDVVEEELFNFPPTHDSIRTLLEMLEVLKQELNSLSKKQIETKKEQEEGRNQRLKLNSKLRNLQKHYDELKRIYDGSMLASANTSVSEDRVYNVMHVNRTPLLMASKVSRKLVMNHEDDPIDEDVSLIQPFLFKSKLKATKTSNKPSATVTSSSNTLMKPSSEEGDEKLSKTKKKSTEFGLESVTRKRKSEDGCPTNQKKISKANKPEISTNTTTIKRVEEPQPSTSKMANRFGFPRISSSASIMKNNLLKKCDLSPIVHNNTIDLSSDNEDDFFSPMQLRGNIPGVKITPLFRPSIKSAAGRALMNGVRKK